MTNDALKVYLSETNMLQDVIGEITAKRDRLRKINADLLAAAVPILAALIKDCGEPMDDDDETVGWIIAPDESESQDMAVTFRMMKDLRISIAKAQKEASLCIPRD